MISKGIIYIEDIKVLLVTQGNLGENEISMFRVQNVCLFAFFFGGTC